MKDIIEYTKKYVRATLEGESSGHDWWHIHRVYNLSKQLQKNEGGDLYIIKLSALLHDISDWKFHGGDETIGEKITKQVLGVKKVPEEIITHICEIISTLSYKGAGVETPMRTIEGKIVQDADRLDAMGAVGIARTFAYGGWRRKEIYDPNIQPKMHGSFEEYKKNTSPVINHFHEKLLLLKDRMNTETARRIAGERHRIMEEFLGRFHQEWEGHK